MDVALVTGAGRGLGLAIARRLARRGLAVLVTDLDAEAAERGARDLGRPAWAAGLDVRDADACRAIAREAASRGRLVTWVNNAGVLFSGPAWAHSDAEVDLTVAVNLMGALHGSRAAVERMGDGGRILNVASLSALGHAPGVAVYAATKHAVLAFGTSLEADLRAAGRAIEVRMLCPDVIDTQMVRDQVEVEHGSILWSGAAPLSVDDVGDRAIALLESKALASGDAGLARRSAAPLLPLSPASAARLTAARARRGDPPPPLAAARRRLNRARAPRGA